MIYLASPYTDSNSVTMQMRYADALYATAKFVQQGHKIYSPIVHFHPIACMHNLPRDIEFWWEMSKDMIERAAGFWVLKIPGWENSIGVTRETVLAQDLGLPVRFVEQP